MNKALSEIGFKKGDGETITALYAFVDLMGKQASTLGMLSPDAAKALKKFDGIKPALLKLAAEVEK